MSKLLDTLAIVVASLAVAIPSWAGQQVATPGPVVGAGIPAVLGLGYVYRMIRKSRGK